MAGETYPDDSVQSLVREWWVPDTSRSVVRGRLLRAFVPYPEQKPLAIIPKGRLSPTDHTHATVEVVPFHIDRPARGGGLPVAAMPLRAGEAYYAVRGKVRPVVVLSEGGEDVPAELRRGQAWQSARTLLVAPYYGGDADGERAGWNPRFVERIRRAEYPQYVWDRLPIPAGGESILRLDNTLPVGADPAAYRLEGHRLSGEALELLDEWLIWLFSGELPATSVLADIRAGLR